LKFAEAFRRHVDCPDSDVPRATVRQVSAAYFGVPVTTVLRDARDGTLYGGLDHGHFGVKLHRSDDDGTSWSELPSPAYPDKGDEVDINAMTQEPLEWTTKLLWSLEAGYADDAGVLWCGTIPGRSVPLSRRSLRIHTTPTPRGSCRRALTRCACRSVGG
jgi:hypothetical protein